MANNGGIAIGDKTKLTVTKLETTTATLAADLQTLLRGATYVNGDVIYQFEFERKKDSNQVIVYVIWEDQ